MTRFLFCLLLYGSIATVDAFWTSLFTFWSSPTACKVTNDFFIGTNAVCTNIQNDGQLMEEIRNYLEGRSISLLRVTYSPNLRTISGNPFINLHRLRTIEITKTPIEKTSKTSFYIRNGVLSKLLLSKNELSTMPKFDNVQWNVGGYNNLKYLDLSYNKIKQVKEGTLEQLLNLETIKLNSNQIHYVGSRAFYGNTLLKEIDLSSNKLTVLNNEAFLLSTGNNRIFTTLNLTSNKIAFTELGDGRPAFSSPLNRLDLRQNFLARFPEANLKQFLNNMAAVHRQNYINYRPILITCTKDVNPCKTLWITNNGLFSKLVSFEGDKCYRTCNQFTG